MDILTLEIIIIEVLGALFLIMGGFWLVSRKMTTQKVEFEELFAEKPRAIPKIRLKFPKRGAVKFIAFLIPSLLILGFINANYFIPTIAPSHSMNYIIGSKLLCDRVPFHSLRVGDVITWARSDDVKIIHRIYAIGDGYVRTRGDNNNFVDSELVTEQNYIAKCPEA